MHPAHLVIRQIVVRGQLSEQFSASELSNPKSLHLTGLCPAEQVASCRQADACHYNGRRQRLGIDGRLRAGPGRRVGFTTAQTNLVLVGQRFDRQQTPGPGILRPGHSLNGSLVARGTFAPRCLVHLGGSPGRDLPQRTVDGSRREPRLWTTSCAGRRPLQANNHSGHRRCHPSSSAHRGATEFQT